LKSSCIFFCCRFWFGGGEVKTNKKAFVCIFCFQRTLLKNSVISKTNKTLSQGNSNVILYSKLQKCFFCVCGLSEESFVQVQSSRLEILAEFFEGLTRRKIIFSRIKMFKFQRALLSDTISLAWSWGNLQQFFFGFSNICNIIAR
jgi:hypothetical protein